MQWRPRWRQRFFSTLRVKRPPLHEQFVRKNAQAIDRGGFDPENNGTERDRAAAATARERELGRSEIPFRADEHEDAGRKISMFARKIGQDFFQMEGIGLERADQLQIIARIIFL